MKLNLLLARAGEGRPALREPLPVEAASNAPQIALPPEPTYLTDLSAEPDSLKRQRWALVVPKGPQGDRLAKILEPLRRLREEEQEAEAEVFQVAPGQDAEAARHFREARMQPASRSSRRHARYVLLAGAPDVLSLELQEELLSDGSSFVGRLAFEDERGYEEYVAKVIEHERRRRQSAPPRAVFLSIQDDSVETSAGHDFLVRPVAHACRRDRDDGFFPAIEVVEEVVPAGGLASLRRHSADPRPGVLFTMSHGLGPPSTGWKDAAEQRRRQGSMYLGANVELTQEQVGGGPFVPGGFWFYFACFGGGTPRQSLYLPWMEQLRNEGELSDDELQAALASRPVDGRPFTAAIAQAALANPEGPLAIIAHQDLAWAYSFFDAQQGMAHPDRFVPALASLIEGHRAGVALHSLTQSASRVDEDLRRIYQAREQARSAGQPPPREPVSHARLWMERHDLTSYVLLGDPATRLSCSPAPVR